MRSPPRRAPAAGVSEREGSVGRSRGLWRVLPTALCAAHTIGAERKGVGPGAYDLFEALGEQVLSEKVC